MSLTVYPPPRPLAQQLAEAFRISAAQAAAAALPLDGARLPASLSRRVAGWLGALAEGGALLVPPVWVEIH